MRYQIRRSAPAAGLISTPGGSRSHAVETADQCATLA
jgi:hypothetical protein